VDDVCEFHFNHNIYDVNCAFGVGLVYDSEVDFVANVVHLFFGRKGVNVFGIERGSNNYVFFVVRFFQIRISVLRTSVLRTSGLRDWQTNRSGVQLWASIGSVVETGTTVTDSLPKFGAGDSAVLTGRLVHVVVRVFLNRLPK
jgi:hypothetical protein